MTKHKPITFLLFICAVALGLLLARPAAADDNSHLVRSFNAFNTTGYIENTKVSVAEQQPDGKLVTAHAHEIDAQEVIRVHRHLPNGALDPSFGTNGRADIIVPNRNYHFSVAAIGFQDDGRIIIAGTQIVDFDEGDHDFVVVRLTVDGTLDATFQINPIDDLGNTKQFGVGVTGMAIQPDDKIVMAATIPDCGLFLCDAELGLIRYNANGSLDSSFHHDGKWRSETGGYSYTANVELMDDGRIVLFGTFEHDTWDSRLAIARFMPNGDPDNTLDGDGYLEDLFNPHGNGVLFSDGSMAVASLDGGIMKLKADGSLDQPFHFDGYRELDDIFTSQLVEMVATPEGGMLVSAPSTVGEGDNVNFVVRVAKFTPNGFLDSRFGEDGIISYAADEYRGVYHLTYTDDGRIILIAGISFPYRDFTVYRLLPDGQLDTGGWVTSKLSAGYDVINDMLIQPDGKIVVTGETDNGAFALARYHHDGSLDTSVFDNGILTNNTPGNYGFSVALDTQNNILPVNGYYHDDGTFGYRILRYDASDGTYMPFADASPSHGPIGDWGGNHNFVADHAVHWNDTFYVAGTSDGYGMVTRYTADGALDLTYAGDGTAQITNPYGDMTVSAMAIDPGNQIVLAGKVGTVMTVLRLHPNGSFDTGFNRDGVFIHNALNSVGESYSDVIVLDDRSLVLVGTIGAVGERKMLVSYLTFDGVPDTTKGNDGHLIIHIGRDLVATSMALDKDGSLMVAGCVQDTLDSFAVARIRSNGQLNTDFGDNGVLILDETPTSRNACAHAIALDPVRDEFVLAGYSTTMPNLMQFALARIERGVPLSAPTAVHMVYLPMVQNEVPAAAAVTSAAGLSVATLGLLFTGWRKRAE